MPDWRFASVGWLAPWALASGCQAHGSAAAQVDARGGLGAHARGSAQAEARPEAASAGGVSLVRSERGAELDYCAGKEADACEIKFEYDSDKLRTDDASTTETLASLEGFLRAHDRVEIEIQGHTDSRGADPYNLELSTRRAAALRRWLIDRGVAESRMTSVGKGEGETKQKEPAECRDVQPPYPVNPAHPCQVAWQRSRRVVFGVTAGAESVEEKPNAQPPEAPPIQPAQPPPPAGCEKRYGVRFAALGPGAYPLRGPAGGADAAADLACWLEASVGVGLLFTSFESRASTAADAFNGSSKGAAGFVVAIPLRARFWLLGPHSPVIEAGVGAAYFQFGEQGGTSTDFRYHRAGWAPFGHAGVGYGYRPSSSFRVAAIVGAAVRGGLPDSQTMAAGSPPSFAQWKRDLDAASDELGEVGPYAELSLGWFFWP